MAVRQIRSARMSPSLPARLVVSFALLAVALGACAPRLAVPGPGLEVLGIPDGLREEFLVTDDGVLLPLRVWRPEALKATSASREESAAPSQPRSSQAARRTRALPASM